LNASLHLNMASDLE